MFRILDNVPEVYINESRDFLIISRLYDLMFCGVKYDIDSMVNILDATLVKDNMLQLMCSKIGFFPRIEIDANILKYIIASFPYIIKNKGSKRGVEFAVNAILKSEVDPSSLGSAMVQFINKPTIDTDEYTIYIYTSISLTNKLALLEVLRYVLPIGCNYLVIYYNSASQGKGDDNITTIYTNDRINVIKASNKVVSSIRSSSRAMDEPFDRLVGAVNTSTIIGSNTSTDLELKEAVIEQVTHE